MDIALSNIHLVDTNAASWEQIIEFRKDKNARKKLRNLRLFVHENYTNKSPAFIEDDLNKRLEQYYYVCRDFGFETKVSLMSCLFDSKTIMGTFVLSLGASLMGEPFLASGALFSGMSIEVGKISIEIAKKRYAYHKLNRDHPLAYIIEAKKLTK